MQRTLVNGVACYLDQQKEVVQRHKRPYPENVIIIPPFPFAVSINVLLSVSGSPHRLPGRIIIFSGQTGKVLRWVGVPDKRESYYSPQVYLLPGGKEMVLFGTGGETHPGSLWRISLSDLYAGKIERASNT